jgi:hypothetical protein
VAPFLRLRQARAESLGVRIANVIRHGDYFGVQLHPKDTGAAMLEFNSTVGGGELTGPYAPAGPNWQRAVRENVARRLAAVEIECPEPGRLAAGWGRILERPVQDLGGDNYRIALDVGAINFLPSAESEAVLAGMELEVANAATVMATAQARGCAPGDASVSVCGVRFRLSAAKT